jgi:heterodisulfide reductase subunit D
MNAKTVHITQLVAELIDSGKLRPEKGIEGSVTYHDPCHLGRHTGIYEEPRKILESIPGIKLVEMERTRDEARCCGAGGGVKTAFPELSQKIADLRVKDAESTGADMLVTSCPFCYQSLKSAIETKGSSLRMMDILELLALSAQKR